MAVASSDSLHRLTTTFGGHACGQTVADWFLWELILNDRPDLCAIVEIGTWQGGFSRYLYAQAAMRGMKFVTFDAVEPDSPPPGFIRRDVFATHGAIETLLVSYDGPVILLCDGGNKPREVRMFGPYLPPASLIVVHDWLTEFMPEDVPSWAVPVYEDACDEMGSMSRVFEREGD